MNIFILSWKQKRQSPPIGWMNSQNLDKFITKWGMYCPTGIPWYHVFQWRFV